MLLGRRTQDSSGDLMRALLCHADLDEGGVDLRISLKFPVDSIDTMHFYYIKMLSVCLRSRDN